MEIFWLKHAAFKIKTESGTIIYLDPFKVPKGEEKADIIICSHDHGDHFDEESINNILKDSTLILGPISISEVLDKYKGKGLKLYEPFKIDDILIEFIPAYNIKRKRESGEPFHPKERIWAGTILEIEGKKIYHAGDTERIPEMKELASRNIDVAMLPCGGMYTMDFEESTDVAVDIKAKIVIPMHNWDKKMQEYKNILAKKDSQIKVETL
ncbi:MAG: MBL fold metallo-hydrolase, partial [Candidatus Lokiarchaeota archaeon]|nr:MBL fold metallo-hydrolase [Candidatus Lokiarchaeota archaeon]